MLPAEGPELPTVEAQASQTPPAKAASLSAAAGHTAATAPCAAGPSGLGTASSGDANARLQARLAKSEGERLMAQAQGDKVRAESAAVEAQEAELRKQNSELKAELAVAKQMQDFLRDDAHEEASVAQTLKQQLAKAEESVQAGTTLITEKATQEAFQFKSKEAALEAEVAHAQKVADQMQENLSKEAALVAHLRSQLSMAEALSEDPNAAAAISSILDATRKDRGAEELKYQLSEEQELVRQLKQELEEAKALNSTLGHQNNDDELKESVAEAAQWAKVATNLREEMEEALSQKSTMSMCHDFSSLTSTSTIPQKAAAAVEAAKANNAQALGKALDDVDEESLASVLLSTSDGYSLLQVALQSGAFQAAAKLLEEGQKLFERHEFEQKLQDELFEQKRRQFLNGSSTGPTALSMLCQREDATSEIFELLMEAQADPFQPDADGRTPFLECARVGNCDFMTLLLKGSRGMVLLDMDRECKTALHYAAQAGHKDVIDLLLKAGMSVEAMDLEGHSAAFYANEAGHDEVVAMIAAAMSDDLLEEIFVDDGPKLSPAVNHDMFDEMEDDWTVPSDDPGLEIPEEEHLQSRLQEGIRHLSPEANFGPGHRLQDRTQL